MSRAILVSGRRPVSMDRDDGFDGIAEVFRQQASHSNVMQQILHRHTDMIQQNTVAIGDLTRATTDRLNIHDERIEKLERSLTKLKAKHRLAQDRAQSLAPALDLGFNHDERAATVQPEVLPLTPTRNRSASVAPKGRGASAQRLSKLKPYGQGGRRLLCPMCGNDYSRAYVLQHMDNVCHN